MATLPMRDIKIYAIGSEWLDVPEHVYLREPSVVIGACHGATTSGNTHREDVQLAIDNRSYHSRVLQPDCCGDKD
jgi:hypothetical protein